jgi:hypothetical protein
MNWGVMCVKDSNLLGSEPVFRRSEESRFLNLEGSSSEKVRFFFDYFTVKKKAPEPPKHRVLHIQ